MNDIENIMLVERYVDALKNGEMEKVGQLLSDDVIWHQPGKGHLSGIYRGKQNLFPHLGKFTELSNNTFRVDNAGTVMANGDLVSTTLHFVAERAGRHLSMDGVDLMRIEGGKIKEVWLFSADQAAEDAFWS
jgi:uncharacterized protein